MRRGIQKQFLVSLLLLLWSMVALQAGLCAPGASMSCCMRACCSAEQKCGCGSATPMNMAAMPAIGTRVEPMNLQPMLAQIGICIFAADVFGRLQQHAASKIVVPHVKLYILNRALLI